MTVKELKDNLALMNHDARLIVVGISKGSVIDQAKIDSKEHVYLILSDNEAMVVGAPANAQS